MLDFVQLAGSPQLKKIDNYGKTRYFCQKLVNFCGASDLNPKIHRFLIYLSQVLRFTINNKIM